jgi:arylsulfatase A-like enzyme
MVSGELSRRDFIKTVAGGAALLATSRLSWATGKGDSEPKLPNVILLLSDDQTHEEVGYAGSFAKTPVLDEMAKTGLVFKRFYSPAASCSPSRAAFMTGRTPNRTGVPAITYPIRLQERCLPQLFRKRGYFTAHVGKWHLGNGEKGGPVASGYEAAAWSGNKFDDNPRFRHENCQQIDNKGESSLVAIRYALHLAQRARKAGKPFFITVWFGSPHPPYGAAGEYRKLYKDRSEEQRNWAAEVTGMDAAIGELRKKLTEMDARENTLLWFSGDNGKPKGSIRRSGIRVPSVAEWPARWKKPRTINAPCSTLDYLPTFASLLDLKASPDGRPIDGQDIWRILDGKADSRPEPIPFWDPGSKHSGQPDRLWKSTLALVGDRYELYVDDGRNKLLDLKQDPTGKKTFQKKQPEQVQKMRAKLERFQKSVMKSVKGEDYKSGERGT